MVGGNTKKVGKGQTMLSLLCYGENSEFCSESEGKPLGDFKQENYIIWHTFQKKISTKYKRFSYPLFLEHEAASEMEREKI